MALVTHDDLIDAVQTEFNDSSELTDAVVTDLIRRTEVKINRRSRLRNQERLDYVTYDQSITSRRIATPANMTEMLNLSIKLATANDDKYVNLTYVAPRRIFNFLDHPLRYYTLRKGLEFNKVADEPHTVRMHYFVEWDLANDGSTWLMAHHPDLYLYGTLVEAGMFMKDLESIAIYRPLFADGIDELNKLDDTGRDDSQLDVNDVSFITGGTYGYRRSSRYNVLNA